eukprot:1502109-Pleurochrysis_carterae.AAC.1
MTRGISPSQRSGEKASSADTGLDDVTDIGWGGVIPGLERRSTLIAPPHLPAPLPPTPFGGVEDLPAPPANSSLAAAKELQLGRRAVALERHDPPPNAAVRRGQLQSA